MQFELDTRSPVPPSEQLADQVRLAIAAGRLREGDKLPSVREVAKSARLNPNTVSRAWRELEFGGFVRSRRGSGVFVADGATPLAKAHRTQSVAERLGRSIGEALAAGLTADEVVELAREACRAWPDLESNAITDSSAGARSQSNE